jgi:8-oxo-dGTP pyrophosphatase MutT (NUDIX family)
MARRRDGARALSGPAARPPLAREFSAGGLVFRRRGTQWQVVLVARKQGGNGPLVWGIPKGHIEAGERSPDTAVREVREETGLVAVVEQLLGDVTYWYARRDESGRAVRIWKRVRFFLMRHRGGRFADRDDEMDAVRWFKIAEAEATVAFANERSLVRRARQLLEQADG